jgi:hypothetical protein
MNCLLSIIRKPHGLVALVSRVLDNVDLKNDVPATLRINSRLGCYEIVESPLELLRPSLFSKKDPVIASWNYLSCVDEFNSETLFHVLVVVINTVWEPFGSDLVLPNLPSDRAVRVIKPTAANPRAYKGTKYKPPKSKIISQFDLRLYLCDRKHQNQLLLRLSEYWVEAIERLEKAGDEVSTRSAKILSITAESKKFDPYYGFNHNLCIAGDYPSLPIIFHRYFWFSLQGLEWSDVTDYISIYWQFKFDENLENQDPILLALSRLISLQPDRQTWEWCRIIVQQPETLRLIFITIAIETQVYTLNPTDLLIAGIDRFNQSVDETDYIHKLYCFFIALKTGISIDYILAGFKLSAIYPYQHEDFNQIDGDSWFPDTAVDRLIQIGNFIGFSNWQFYNTWRTCGKLAGSIDLILSIDWEYYQKDDAEAYIFFYLYIIDLYAEDPVEIRSQKSKWEFIKKQVDEIDDLLRNTEPGYRKKVIKDLNQYYCYWDKVEELNLYIPIAHVIVQRLARSPFAKDINGNFAWIIAHFINNLEPQLCQVFISTPDPSFLSLEQACRLDNDARLIPKGIAAISKNSSAFTLQCFIDFPNKLFKVAKLLGSFSNPVADSVVKKFSQQPMMTENITLLDLKETCEFIDRYIGDRFSNPIPRKIRSYLHGEISLKSGQIDRAVGTIHQQLQLTKLEILEDCILTALKREFDVDPHQEDIKHALAMLGSIDENFRPFRKFLKAYWQDPNSNYLLNHPLSQSWLKQHPQIASKIDVWMQGIDCSYLIAEFGTIEIKLETQPLEVLKMGTYVGSCLGLGGICAYSAVAVLLNINKQVLYARDRQGKIIARQLIAISESEELVCFSIYPYHIHAQIQNIFYEYILMFADALGLKLYRDAPDHDRTYDIVNIISQSWWDDNAWDFSSRLSNDRRDDDGELNKQELIP